VKTDEQGSKPKAHSQDEQDVALEENSHRPGDGEASHTEAMDVDSEDESLQTDKRAEGQKKAGAKDKKTAKVKETDIKEISKAKDGEKKEAVEKKETSEESVVPLGYTGANPGTVMVMYLNARVTGPTMGGSGWTQNLAGVTVSEKSSFRFKG
jgi:hypothetical protein